jgi:hypothetical protein
MDYLIGSNNLANAIVWYTMNVGVLFTLYLGGTFLNRRGTKWLGIWASIGEESPSSAWEVLCEGCAQTWCAIEDFTTGDKDWLVAAVNPAGVISPTGWQPTDIISETDARWRGINIEKEFDSSTITSIKLDYDLTIANFDGNTTALAILYSTGGGETVVFSKNRDNVQQGTGVQIEWTGSIVMSKIRLFIRSSLDTTSPYMPYAGSCLIPQVEICGDGTKPPQFT